MPAEESDHTALPNALSSSGAQQPKPEAILTLRVLLLSLLLIPLNAWWLTEIEYVRYSDNATTQAIFFNAVSLLLILLGINRFLYKVRPCWQFSMQEMVTLYVVVAIASNLAGHDQLQILFTTLTYVFRHDTPETGWGSKIIPYLPKHLVVSNKEAIDPLYTGGSTLYRWEHIQPWIGPLAWWTLFVMLVVWTMLCMTAIFRRQWDAERLSYPIAEIPIQLLMDTERLFKAALLWGGVAIGASGQLLNLVHALVPSVPSVPIGVQTFTAQSYPWNAAGPLPISSFPFAYGLAFLLPAQLGFSCWFFFLLSRVELVGAAMLGYVEWGKFPYIQQQGVGAVFGLFLAVVWAARAHLVAIWRDAINIRGWGRPSLSSLSSSYVLEPMSYRTALFGFILGMAGMIGFAVLAGMRWHTAAFYLGILFVIVLVVARLRAELGLPTYELYQAGADQILHRTAGTTAWTHNELAVMTLFFWLSRTHRQFPMQSQVDAMRVGHRTRTPLPILTLVILAASALGTLAAFWAYMQAAYRIGYESAKFQGPVIWAFGREPWQKMDAWVSSPQPIDAGTVGAYLFGMGFTLFLAAMRARFVWWPFHPAGYLVAGSFGLFRLWLPIFVSWLLKVLILRYGGLRGYRRALPFFLGLVLGEFSAGFVRTILDLLFKLHLPAASGIGGL